MLAKAWLAASAVVIAMSASNAYGQGTTCAKSELMLPTIAIAKTGADAARVSAIKTLADNWQLSLPDLMQELSHMQRTPASTWSKAELDWYLSLTSLVRFILSAYDQSIVLFRICYDDSLRKPQLIKPLVWAARGDNKELRLNSANILANAVDNTTVCFVLHHLYKDRPPLTDEGRANLLGITRTMASYAYSENVAAINLTINELQRRLGDDLKKLPQTQALIVDIIARAASSKNAAAGLPAELQEYCKNYSYTVDVD